jgi:hypothetical protein
VNQNRWWAVNDRFCLDLDKDVWMEVDFIEVFCDEDSLQHIHGLFSAADEMMESYGDMIPSPCLEEIQESYDRASDQWDAEDFIWAGLYLTSITESLQSWGEYVDLFPVAEAIIANSTDIDPLLLDGLNSSLYAPYNSSLCRENYPLIHNIWHPEAPVYYLKAIIEIPDLLPRAKEAITEAEEIGIYDFVLEKMKQKLFSAKMTIAAGGAYSPGRAAGYLRWVLEALLRRKGELTDEKNILLYQVEEAIIKAEGSYSYQAIVNGMKHNYANGHLQVVLDMGEKYFDISEPTLLPILGLFLLSTFTRRRSG